MKDNRGSFLAPGQIAVTKFAHCREQPSVDSGKPVDPDGWAVAMVDIEDVHEWQPSEVEAACATTWQSGDWARCLENIRPIKSRFRLPAKREIYEVDLHLRAAAVILNNDAVLFHRREEDAFWALPGGRIEPGKRHRMLWCASYAKN